MKKTVIALQLAVAFGIGIASVPADATLTLRSAFQNSALSIDGWGTGGDAAGLQVDTPSGAIVQQAYLYSSDVNGSGLTGTITFQGVVLNGGTGTLLTPNLHPASHEVFNVTSIVKPIIEAGPGGVINFSISEQGSRDGQTLVVVYSHATTVGGTAIILDGELSQGGDTTALNFAAPYTGGNVIVSLASTYSFNGSGTTNTTRQVTNVDVTTSSQAIRRLTSCAGGNDDGNFTASDGSLITVGGVGDSTANPNPNCAGGAGDDELYNLGAGNSANASPFLAAGDTSLLLTTNNPSFDDNVYGLFLTSAFTITQVDDEVIIGPPPPPPTNGVPVPGTALLMGLGLIALSRVRKNRSS